MLKLSFATLTPPASMTHPQNYFHSWAVNEGSDLAPFTLELWATVSAILITLARTWQLIRCSLTITDECPNSDAAASDFPTNLLFPLTEMLFCLTTRTTQPVSYEAGRASLATIPIRNGSCSSVLRVIRCTAVNITIRLPKQMHC